MTKGIFSILAICTVLFSHVDAQYISGKTLPDRDTKLIQDLNDISYKISTTITTPEIK